MTGVTRARTTLNLRMRVLVALLAVPWPMVHAGSIWIEGGGGRFAVFAKSLNEARWDTVVRQKYDFSCGSAAVATLLSFHYDLPTTEEEVFREMFEAGDQRQIQRAGFSMLDMKSFLDRRGFRSDGFQMTLEKFAEIGVPGITLTNTNGYTHFVVVKGIDDSRVLVGDPARGTRVIGIEKFESAWTGSVLAGREAVQTARLHFNRMEDWRLQPKAPLGEAVSRSAIGFFTLTLPGRHEFGR